MNQLELKYLTMMRKNYNYCILGNRENERAWEKKGDKYHLITNLKEVTLFSTTS